jgi:hypothetical protein
MTMRTAPLVSATLICLLIEFGPNMTSPSVAASRETERVQPGAPPTHSSTALSANAPGWIKTNVSGFGDATNYDIFPLAGYSGNLYAGTYNPIKGGQLWRTSPSLGWTAVMTGGFGSSSNIGVESLGVFNGAFFAGTTNTDHGAQVWRSSDGTHWNQIAIPAMSSVNGEIFQFAVFSSTLYFGTWVYTSTQGAEIWRSSTGNSNSWTRVVPSGFGSVDNQAIVSFGLHNGYLYAGTFNPTSGGEIWRSANGSAWVQVSTDGFGTFNNWGIGALDEYNGYLYAATRTADGSGFGTQVWRCQTCDQPSDWVRVVDNAFGNSSATGRSGLEVYDGFLYLVVPNPVSGMQVWRTLNGTAWEQVATNGFGDSANVSSYWDNSVIVFSGGLYIGTETSANGGQVWLYLGQHTFVPVARRE